MYDKTVWHQPSAVSPSLAHHSHLLPLSTTLMSNGCLCLLSLRDHNLTFVMCATSMVERPAVLFYWKPCYFLESFKDLFKIYSKLIFCVCRNDMGESGGHLCIGRCAGCGLCAAGPNRNDFHSSRQHGSVCLQGPGPMAYPARWMGEFYSCSTY